MASRKFMAILLAAAILCIFQRHQTYSKEILLDEQEPVEKGREGFDFKEEENVVKKELKERVARQFEEIEESNESAIGLNATASTFTFVQNLISTILSPLSTILKNGISQDGQHAAVNDELEV